MSTSKPQFGKTEDYSLFEVHECNRPLVDKPELERSMKEHGFMPSCAIHVRINGSGKLKVIRGHHRLHYARRLKLPVYYIIDGTDVDIFDMEGDYRVMWNMRDFATARANDGSDDCAKLVKWSEKTGIPIGIAASLLAGESAGSHNAQRLVKQGKFKIGDTSHAQKCMDLIDHMAGLGAEFSRTGLFVVAVSKCLRVPEFDVEHFKAKVSLYPMNVHRRTTVPEYIAEIEALYNYAAKSAKQRIPLSYRVKEVGMNRKNTFGKKS